MEAALKNADRQTDKYEVICSFCDYANTHKITCDSRGGTKQGNFSIALNQLGQETLALALAAPKDICTCQFYAIVSHKHHGLNFVQTVL